MILTFNRTILAKTFLVLEIENLGKEVEMDAISACFAETTICLELSAETKILEPAENTRAADATAHSVD